MSHVKKTYIVGSPNYETSWAYYICDTEGDLPLGKVQAGDEAFVKSCSKTFKGTEDGKWVEEVGIPSSPPSGKCKVKNFYVDPATGKLVVEYDNNPVP